MTLTKTDLAKQELVSKILENRNKVPVGEIVKYKKMTEILDIKYHTGGKGKKIQVELIKQYIEWGDNFMVYSTSKEINEFKVITKNSNSAYNNFVRDCLVMSLVEKMEKIPELEDYTFSKTQMLKMAEIISEGYLLTSCIDNGDKIASALIGVSTEAIKEYKEVLRVQGISIVESALRQMEKQGYLTMDNKAIIFITYLIDNEGKRVKDKDGKYKVNYTSATYKEKTRIKEVETEVLYEMYKDIERKNRLFTCKQRGEYNLFRAMVCKRLNEKYRIKADRYFEAFIVTPNKGNSDYNLERIASDCMLNTKSHITKKMLTSKNQRYRKALKENSFGADGFQSTVAKLNSFLVYNDIDFNESFQNALSSGVNESLECVMA